MSKQLVKQAMMGAMQDRRDATGICIPCFGFPAVCTWEGGVVALMFTAATWLNPSPTTMPIGLRILLTGCVL